MGRRAEIQRLAEEQEAELAREDRSAKLPRTRGEVRFSELPEAKREQAEEGGMLRRAGRPRQWAVYLYGCDPAQWDAASQPDVAFHCNFGLDGSLLHLNRIFAEVRFPIRCPVCLERDLPPGWYCLACDRAGLDQIDADPAHPFAYPGDPIDAS